MSSHPILGQTGRDTQSISINSITSRRTYKKEEKIKKRNDEEKGTCPSSQDVSDMKIYDSKRQKYGEDTVANYQPGLRWNTS